MFSAVLFDNIVNYQKPIRELIVQKICIFVDGSVM